MGPRTLPLGSTQEELFCDQSILDGILDLLKCPICLEILDSPSRVRDCGHIFCSECAEKNSRLYKPAQCALCRTMIQTRRDLRKDAKLASIIYSIVPDVKRFRHFMNIYMQDKSDKELFQEVSKQSLFDISHKIQRNIGKAKKKKKCILVTADHQEIKRRKDVEFFSKLMKSQAGVKAEAQSVKTEETSSSVAIVEK